MELRVAYARAAKIEALNRLRTTRPVLATWDDQDEAGGEKCSQPNPQTAPRVSRWMK